MTLDDLRTIAREFSDKEVRALRARVRRMEVLPDMRASYIP